MGWRPCLILLPLRLGLDKLNPIYFPALKEIFKFPQCQGIMGGKPSQSLFFLASQENHLFYLDPHEVQPSISMERSFFATVIIQLLFFIYNFIIFIIFIIRVIIVHHLRDYTLLK